MAWDQLLQPGLLLKESPVESARFGVSIARISVGPGPLDTDRMLQEIARAEADVLFVRYDARRVEIGAVLARSGRTVIPAGTLVYWDKAAEAGSATAPGASALELVVTDGTATPEFSQFVRVVVRSAFEGYVNHYAVNPLLDAHAALEGYEDWALRSLHSPSGVVVIMRLHGTPIGVATLAESPSREHVEVLLAGLVPSVQGRHLYDALLSGCERVALRRGAARLLISTQAHNVRAQRAWARNGLRPLGALETVHLVRPGLLPEGG